MQQKLRIAVADDESTTLTNLKEALIELGHDVVCAASSGHELVEACLRSPPDLIITDFKMPDLDGIEAARRVGYQHPVPVILITAHSEPHIVQRAIEDQILAYLVKPVKQESLGPAIALAVHRFREFEALRLQAANLQQALEDRKIIERAKGILMRRAALDEPTAFSRLQKLARDKNQKLVDVARSILTADEALSHS